MSKNHSSYNGLSFSSETGCWSFRMEDNQARREGIRRSHRVEFPPWVDALEAKSRVGATRAAMRGRLTFKSGENPKQGQPEDTFLTIALERWVRGQIETYGDAWICLVRLRSHGQELLADLFEEGVRKLGISVDRPAEETDLWPAEDKVAE